MKKIILAMAVLFNGTLIMAQSELDALKYLQTDINGTARYMGMAGAFGALGGDASAIKDNPAGLGIYRSSEISGTANIMMQSSKSNWNGTISSSKDPQKMGFNNFSFVLSSPTLKNEGLINSNWSFSYNRLKNMSRSVNIKSGESASSITDFMGGFTGNIQYYDLKYTSNYEPYDNQNIPWISILAYDGGLLNEFINPDNSTNHWESLLANGQKVTPSFSLTEKGYIDAYSVGWGGNFSNRFYLGTTLNFQKIDYSLSSQYGEIFNNGGDLSLNNGDMSLKNIITSSGSGLNLNIGGIVRPTDFLRFGLSLQTPTIYSMQDHYEATLNYNNILYFNSATSKTEKKSGTATTPTDGYNDFKIQGPMKFDISAAFIIGKKGIISAEYDYSNYMGSLLMSKDGDPQIYNVENQRMSTSLNDGNTIKIGGEYKLTDNFSLRAGYAISTSDTKSNAQKIMYEGTIRTDTEYFLHNGTNYLTAGFGYREANWFIDFAYVHRNLNESFMPYNSNLLSANLAVTPASVTTTNNNILVTLGLKF